MEKTIYGVTIDADYTHELAIFHQGSCWTLELNTVFSLCGDYSTFDYVYQQKVKPWEEALRNNNIGYYVTIYDSQTDKKIEISRYNKMM